MSDNGEVDSIGDQRSFRRGRRATRNGARTPAKGQKVNGTTGSDRQLARYTSDDGCVYYPSDCVYVDSRRPDVPYFICSVKEFYTSKRGTVYVDVRWFFRPSEVPESVYEPLIHDRRVERGPDNVFDNSIVKQRELFFSDTYEAYPAKLLRGKCSVKDAKTNIDDLADYSKNEDNFFYFFAYNPETRRLISSTKGEIRIGPSHQTTLPECRSRDEEEKKEEDNSETKEKDELLWSPSTGMEDNDLIVYLNASRSMAQLNGFYKTDGDLDEASKIASGDLVTQAAYDTLHECEYDVGVAFERLLKEGKLPAVVQEAVSKWNCSDMKRYVKGMRQFGKNFHRIKKELFPDKETSELVEFYYHWKRTSSALSSRHHRRSRRQVMHWRRLRGVASRKTAEMSGFDFVELSSACESDFDSDDSGERESSLYACCHCYTTGSKDWHHAGFDKVILCTDCRLYFKKYGEMMQIESKGSPPSFIIKNSEEGRMRRRRVVGDYDDEDEDPIGNDRRMTRLQKRRLNGVAGVNSSLKKRLGQPKKSRSKRRKRSKAAHLSGSDDDLANLGDDESDRDSLATSYRSGGSMEDSSVGSAVQNGVASPKKEAATTRRGRSGRRPKAGGGQRDRAAASAAAVAKDSTTTTTAPRQRIRPAPQRPILQEPVAPTLEADPRAWYSFPYPLLGVPMGFPPGLIPNPDAVRHFNDYTAILSAAAATGNDDLRRFQMEQAMLQSCYPYAVSSPLLPIPYGIPEGFLNLSVQDNVMRPPPPPPQQPQGPPLDALALTMQQHQQQQQQALLEQSIAFERARLAAVAAVGAQWPFHAHPAAAAAAAAFQGLPNSGGEQMAPPPPPPPPPPPSDQVVFSHQERERYELARRELLMHDSAMQHQMAAATLGRQPESLLG